MDLTQDSFDRLLAWLDPDREKAGHKYQEIWDRLAKRFRAKGRHDAEELADDTINRVASRVEEIAPGFVGDPASYFFGTANNVFREANRRSILAGELPLDNLLAKPLETELGPAHDCLIYCLERLKPEDNALILRFYEGDKQVKIKIRKQLAAKLSISSGNLSLKAFRIREKLQKCILSCLKNPKKMK